MSGLIPIGGGEVPILTAFLNRTGAGDEPLFLPLVSVGWWNGKKYQEYFYYRYTYINKIIDTYCELKKKKKIGN